MSTEQKTAIIIGAGPAGLTAAYELLQKTDIKPIVLESTLELGGISKTVNYKGNRIDIGGHRFFSKSDRVMDWWRAILPVQAMSPNPATGCSAPDGADSDFSAAGPDPEENDDVLLVRNRCSRILFLRKLFDYPISLSLKTMSNLGPARLVRAAASYVWVCITPKRTEKTLEDFFINRFGKELYRTFFRDYTEKVWGIPCSRIRPEWGAQRVKGLSMTKALAHAVKKVFHRDGSIKQKDTETTLIEKFLYPKFGPGQMWEEVACRIQDAGGEIRLGHRVESLSVTGLNVADIIVADRPGSRTYSISGDYVFSSMPVSDLILNMKGVEIPPLVKDTAEGLVYRDFITVGLLLSGMTAPDRESESSASVPLPDNWIYIQEPDVKVGRLQIFNNWSPYMVEDRTRVWVGLEYFCNEGDDFWRMPDGGIVSFATEEMIKIGFIKKEAVLDSTVIRTAKAYPAYFGTYERFSVIRDFTDGIDNLFLIGRNGMHRYNNQDHSMLAAMTAVDNIIGGRTSKENVWAVNTEEDYHESR
ncbi:MAG TPA: NAD(P)/FAD-dependent oxidoreductase [Acidobacteriota bacterium]|nr:NAD(P)/FAD-dependent oxidoreductase [Acidobacteriota bacterium]